MMACVYFTLPLGGTCGIIAVSSLAHTEAMSDYFLKGPGYFPSFLGATRVPERKAELCVFTSGSENVCCRFGWRYSFIF